MGKDKGTDISSYRRKWQQLFDLCVRNLQTQQTQIESLLKERENIDDRIKTHYEEQISQIKREILMKELAHLLDAAKANMAVGLKEREASMYKLKLDHADDELADFRMLLDCLPHNSPNPKVVYEGKTSQTNKDKGGIDSGGKSDKSTKGEERRSKILDIEVRRLKQEYEKLSLQKSAEVSALLLEKDFVWNQYKTMESDYDNKLKSKRVEVKRANEKIEKLLASAEQLESLNNEKDVTVDTLKAKLANMEADANKKNDEISRLSRELESLRKSSSASVTPVLNRCTVKPRISGLGGGKNGSSDKIVFVKKESSGPQVPDRNSEKGTGSRKRQLHLGVEVIRIPETPTLFSASFKVPKLKNSTPRVR